MLDQDTGDVTRNDDGTEAGMGDLADEGNPAYFYGIDGDTAYWRDTRGAVAVNISTGDVRVIEANARNGFDIVAVENGDLAFSRGAGTAIGPNPQDAVLLPEVWGSRARSRPTGGGTPPTPTSQRSATPGPGTGSRSTWSWASPPATSGSTTPRWWCSARARPT